MKQETKLSTKNDLYMHVINKSETVLRVIVAAGFTCPHDGTEQRNKKENMMLKAAIFSELFNCLLEVPTLSFLYKWHLPSGCATEY